MTTLKKIKILAGVLLLAATVLAIGPAPSKVYADRIQCVNGSYSNVPANYKGKLDDLCLVSGGTIKPGAQVERDTPIQPPIDSASNGGGGDFTTTGDKPISIETDCKDKELTKENCGIVAKLIIFINVLSAMVGIVIVLMIIIGGIQYSASADDAQATAAAKRRITNAVMALMVFLFMFAFLQWAVPGGIF